MPEKKNKKKDQVLKNSNGIAREKTCMNSCKKDGVRSSYSLAFHMLITS